MELKRVVAFDEDDLIVMSAHLEGAKILRSNIAFLPREKQFVVVAERRAASNPSRRYLTGLHFNRVERVKTNHLPEDETTALTLIGMTFTPNAAPSGFVTMLFEDQCAIRLDVECLEASLSDLPTEADKKD
jgi:hypothetical protein